MGEQENKINIKKSTLKCYECGNRLMADDDCRYFCENCGLEFENEYSLVRAYLKKNGSTEALKVSGATGVAMSKLNHYLRKGMVEVADNSKTFITCKKCGATYNSFSKKPKIAGVCDVCGSNELVDRNDDLNIEAIKKRINIFKENIEGIVSFYEKKSLIFSLNGLKNIDTINHSIMKALSDD